MRKLEWVLTIAVLAGCSTSNTTPLVDNSRSRDRTESVSAAKPTLPADGVASDNTGINQRDRADATLTPLDQGERQDDISLTAQIRKQVVGRKLSTNATNVKIVTQGGRVTLRGPVENQEEKNQIEEIAKSVSGVIEVDNQLETR